MESRKRALIRYETGSLILQVSLAAGLVDLGSESLNFSNASDTEKQM